MKQFKTILVCLAGGVAIGMWLGVNIGRELPWYSNPIDTQTLNQRIKNVSGETLEKGGQALEKTGRALQDKLAK